MEADFQQHHHILHEHHQQQPQMNSGLTRYRSAPSSYFRSLTDREFCDQFFNRPSSPETERIFARFMTSGSTGSGSGGPEGSSQILNESQKSAQAGEMLITTEANQQTPYVSNETRAIHQQPSNVNSNYPPVSSTTCFYQSSMKPPLPNQGMISGTDGSGSMGIDLKPRIRTDGGRTSNLIRQSSSPAGLFDHIKINDSGYAALRGMGNCGTRSSFNEEASFSSPSRLKNFSPRTLPPHSSGLMSPMVGIEKKSIRETNQDTKSFAESQTSDYGSTSFPVGSWEESAVISDNIVGQKPLEDNDDDEKSYSNFNISDTQKVDPGNRPPLLAHHLSLPNTSAEMNAIEKILQFSDSVPCKLRAKRGCATHPRSIAERVRRTKISERMRKLQELVPNMDKQTNTSDMLDLAVEYIKGLQKQVQTLSDNRAKCKCSHSQHQ
ncbi:transcription factor bHLH122 isoform X1 [Benincasa hispida]|uniref:transcription factor bHLH122 isoform X1 n=1 Tax=Benincasa hispida TaxID=102211 RepID=UPI0018FFA111|nr:transcription factor bHLH122 isoform X1 [Benincasa hispida]XP_038879938.1 transcription factor bHLH122 isoform X1 [Benincasa hispida]XP_038879939.1 transcription factor bHLH122 isoform X1 [Benincasa hispida]